VELQNNPATRSPDDWAMLPSGETAIKYIE